MKTKQDLRLIHLQDQVRANSDNITRTLSDNPQLLSEVESLLDSMATATPAECIVAGYAFAARGDSLFRLGSTVP